MKVSQGKRIFTLLLIAAVCFVMLFSVCFIASETQHDCLGENCMICAQLSACENILRLLSCAALMSFCIFTADPLLGSDSGCRTEGYCNCSPVLLKVKLLN